MTTTEQSTCILTDADRAVARKAHAILVLLGAAWRTRSDFYASADPANVTLERVEETVAELLAIVQRGSESATSGGLTVSGDDEVGYDLSVSIGELTA